MDKNKRNRIVAGIYAFLLAVVLCVSMGMAESAYANTDLDSAEQINEGTTEFTIRTGAMDEAWDQYRWFSFTPEETGWYTFELSNPIYLESDTDTSLSLFSSYSNAQSEEFTVCRNLSDSHEKIAFRAKLEAGQTYYIEIFVTGNYDIDTDYDMTLTVSKTEDINSGGNMELDDAIAIEEGSLDFSFYTARNDDIWDQTKWYTFTPSKTGWYLFRLSNTIRFENDDDTTLCLYSSYSDAENDYRTVYKYPDSAGGDISFTKRLEAGQTYYIKVFVGPYYEEDTEYSMTLSVKQTNTPECKVAFESDKITYTLSRRNQKNERTLHVKGNAAETWVSSNEKVVKIRYGCWTYATLYIKRPGTSVITVTDDEGVSTSCKVKVVKRPGKKLPASVGNQTYTGQKLTPEVVIRDGGLVLSEGVDYTVSYSGNRQVGKGKADISFMGIYEGAKAVSFKINPKATKIKRLKRGKRSFTVKWKKQKTQTSGYQIQYSTSKNFKSGKKTILIKKNTITSKKIKKLKAKKKYYVRVRTFKKTGNTRYYSDWSEVKSVRTK